MKVIGWVLFCLSIFFEFQARDIHLLGSFFLFFSSLFDCEVSGSDLRCVITYGLWQYYMHSVLAHSPSFPLQGICTSA